MNKKGFGLLVSLMVAVVLFVLALALAPVLQDVTGEVQNDTLLNCSTTTNSQTQAVCTSIDMQMLFIAIIIGVAGLIIMRSV